MRQRLTLCLFVYLLMRSKGRRRCFSFLPQRRMEVKVIPSIYEFITLRAEAEMFEGLPVITLQGSPLYGWNVVVKGHNGFHRCGGGTDIDSPD